MDAVDKIFQPKPKRSRKSPHEVMYTISSAVDNLHQQIEKGKPDRKAQAVRAIMQGNSSTESNETHHLDGVPQSITSQSGDVKLILQEFARRFRPYNVPPSPVPMDDADNETAAGKESLEEMQAGVFEIEIQEQGSDPYIQQVVISGPNDQNIENGEFFTSNEGPMAEIENPVDAYEIQEPGLDRSSFIQRRRQGQVGDGTRKPGMMTISVKRQRRLKMKKHKFKKLTRRTRNLRMRQGKI